MSNDYIEAARLIKTCPNDRLPFVLRLLELANLVPDGAFDGIEPPKTSNLLEMKRAAKKDKGFPETDYDVALILRKAYEVGASFTNISLNSGGYSRSGLYEIMYCHRKAPEFWKERIIKAATEEIDSVAS